MLNEEQLEILADAIRPLFQSLERDVIMDIVRRVKNTMSYTRTAELMAMDMHSLGYSPNKIRTEVMKVLNADSAYKKTVEQNTIEYKKEVQKLIDEVVEEAIKMGDDIIANAGKMSWVDDMSVWESGGKSLGDNSFLHDLQKAVAEQTVEEFINLTRTTGFKTMSGYESIANAFRNELDKATIKICTGTFSQEKVLNDVIHNLAQSGLRSIDYANGYSMQLDTAVKNALRTGCQQISAKIMDENIQRTGENLVYVSGHWGARNKGIGVENHELWQGKVYFIQPGENYSEEAKRIGQDRIMDIWYSTGYSPDGSHINNPLGLHGYNCRHSHRVWFLGLSELPDEQPEPAPVVINGKEYDYYAMTQKMRYMERNIRALKRECIARADLKLPTTEINARISEKVREYEQFCKKCKVPARTSNLRVDSQAVDITKTNAYSKTRDIILSGINNAVIYNITQNIIDKIKMPNNDILKPYDILKLEEAHKRVLTISMNDNMSKEVALLMTGDMSDIETVIGTATNIDLNVSGKSKAHFVMHNHPNNSSFSNRDIVWFAKNKNTKFFSIVKNNGEIEVLIKDNSFDREVFKLEYERLERKYANDIAQNQQNGYNKVIKRLLEKTKSGIYYVR